MSIDLSVSVRGSVPIFSAAPAIAKANERIGKVGIKAGRIEAAPHRKRGGLARNLRFRKRGNDAEWYDAAPQALFIEEGTGLYGPRKQRIRPKTKKALRWMGPDGPIFAKSVKGIKPDPWLEPAINRSAPIFEGIYTDEVMGAFGG